MVSSGTATVELPTDEQILITREFDAPKHLVYRAYTTPELVKRWWSGQGRGDDRRDRPAGRRQVALGDGVERGFEVAFHGEYQEIVPDERLVSTEIYEIPDQGDSPPTVNTATFTESDGRTTLTVLVECPSKELRDTIIDSGMEGGMQGSYDALERVAASLS